MNFYELSGQKMNGEKVDMQEYAGKVVLIVNTASKCGFTPQFESLEKINKEYAKDGLVILGFPCNQFANQDPEDNESIQEFCTINYGVTFQMFRKIDVNGKNAHPIFKFLKDNSPGLLGKSIKWNFTKFLIDREGNVVERYAPATPPEKLIPKIEELLKKE